MVCLVRVRMPMEGLCSEGLGVSECPCNPQSPHARAESIKCARRFAFNSAMKAAFAKFIIIRLRNGKVMAELDTTQADPQIYNPAWDNPLVKVVMALHYFSLAIEFMISFVHKSNDIDHDPEEEDSDEEFALLEDIDEDELEVLLDATLSKDS
ncbi:hypothetical protein GWK47_049769 [Chionoecetes opilio]|uniref:Uncharacterized protein n=1 Tax=Chionoecetes opilio TaxID=41210 RepID=A0A8J4YAQ0_CHIOP|nr:hypothetical protein GWK47_049769 [Chionoecetes opilio]